MTLILPTAEYRALEVFISISARYSLFPVTRTGFEPHLRVGEIAVVDESDVEPLNGELFVIKIRSPFAEHPDGCVRRLAQIWPVEHTGVDGEPFIGWWHGDLCRPRGMAEVEEWFAKGRMITLCDGPMRLEHMRERIVGRVVGVFQSSAEGPRRLVGGAA